MDVWYPSHIEKAKRAVKSLIKLVSGVIEIVDARAPMATRPLDIEPYFGSKKRLIFLNKADLAEKEITDRWVKKFSDDGIDTSSGSIKEMKNIQSLFDPFRSDHETNILIVGMPNVGKSTLVNMVKRRKATAIGDRPGITRSVQWIRIDERMKILDTPGITYPRVSNEILYAKLGLCNVIDVEKVDFEALVYYELDLISKIRPDLIDQIGEGESIVQKIENYGVKREFILKGGILDINRTLLTIHREITHEKFGKISYELPENV
uniref:Ribosome biogenesis GTPase A n=1 Tax=Mesoaciditoga lauensis TaxID=1495039 RepID=A0A7V3REP6_9BACT